MQLRSGTKLNKVIENTPNINAKTQLYSAKTPVGKNINQEYGTQMGENMSALRKNLVSSDINNLIYTLRLFETIQKDSTSTYYNNVVISDSRCRFILVSLQKNI
jgi:hypothetical protein